MSRIFVPQCLREQTLIHLRGEQHHYIKHVLRMRPGDSLYLFDGTPKEYAAKIAHVKKNETWIQIETAYAVTKESPIDICIGQGIPKGRKLDDLIPQITELGAATLVPLTTDRSDVRQVSLSKLSRWRKIAVQAAQQTGRTQVTQISEPLSLLDFFGKYKKEEKILFYELETSQPFQPILEKMAGPRFCVLIGPEGGFTSREIEAAKSENCHIVSLGKRILRTETVAPAACAIIQFMKGDLGQID